MTKQLITVANKFYILIQMHRIVIFFVFITAGLTLHVSHPIDHHFSGPIPHMQNTVKNPAFDAQFNDMKVLVDSVNKALTAADAKKYQFLITKTSQIQAGLNKLQGTLQSYNLTVTNTSQLCPRITTFNRTELRRYITYIQLKQNAFAEYLSTCLDCSFVSDDFLKIQNLTNSQIQNLNRTMDGVYCDQDKVKSQKASGIVNLNSSYFKNNLNAKNWYYGSTTASDYKIYIFKRSSSYNLTNCPLSTPFVKDDEQVCFDCPEGSIFNLGDQKCDTCKINQILNVKSGQCDLCLGQKKHINGSLVCKLCVLSEGQLFNQTSGKCYRCKNDSYLDTDKLACIKIDCGQNTPRFNNITHQCQPCGVSQIIDPHDVTRCIKTNFIALCPPATPLYDDNTKQCIACPANTNYNKQTNKCVASTSHFTSVHQAFTIEHADVSTVCPSDKPKYNILSKQCEACQSGYIYYKDSKQCEKDVKCGQTQTVNRTTYTCVQTSSTCRNNEVYAIKVNRCLPKSITCNQHQYYSPELQSCVTIQSSCTKDQYYDTSIRKCISKTTKCKANENYNEQLHICQEMILCQIDEQFNFALRICQKKKLKCNQQTQYFDEYHLECAPYSFVTSPYSPNIIYADEFTNYLYQYKDLKTIIPNLKDCPLKAPYYQRSSKSCIVCPSQAPYFDFEKDECSQCPQKQIYNPSQHRCQSINLSSVSSTINRINV